MNVNEFMKKSLVKETIEKPDFYYEYLRIRPRIVCKNGVSLFVQGSETHYCTPRENYPFYLEVEVGYPDIRPPRNWNQYYDGEWQEEGVIGSIKRIVKNLDMVWLCIKHKNWRMLKYHYLNLQDNAQNGVYGYVPVELVDEFINSNGGIDEEKTFAPKEKK